MNRFDRWRRATVSTLRVSWRADAVVMVVSVILVGAVTAGIVAAQRSVDRAEGASLEHALLDAPPEARRLRVAVSDVFTPSGNDDPLVIPRRRVTDAAAAIDPSVLALYDDPRLVIDHPVMVAATVDGDEPASPTRIVMRIQTGLGDHAAIAAGATPATRAGPVDDVDVIEVAVSATTAADLGWTVGTEVLVGASTEDPLFRGFDNLPEPFIIRVATVLDLDQVEDPYWSGDPRLHRAIVTDTGVGAEYTVHAAISEEQFPVVLSVLGGKSALRVEQRWDLVTDRISMDNVEDVGVAVRATEATTSPSAPFGLPSVNIGLAPTLDAEADRRAATQDAIAIAAVGVAAAAIAAFVQLQRVAADRRRPWWHQARARGAGAAPLVTAATLSTAALVAVGLALGWLGGRLLTPGSEPSRVPVGLVAGFAIALLVATTALHVADARRPFQRSADGRGRSRWARAGAVLVVLVAVASTIILRRGGLAVGDAGLDVAVLLPVVFVPSAAAVLLIALSSSLLRGRAIGGLDLGVGRLLGRRRAIEMGSAPSLVFVVILAIAVATTSAALAWNIAVASPGPDDIEPSGPLIDIAGRSFGVAAVGAGVLGVFSVVVATVVTMRRRRHDAELLAALGAETSEFTRAIRSEMLPLVGVSTVVGGLAGVITLHVLAGRLDMSVLTGASTPSIAITLGATVIVMATAFGAAFGVVLLSASWVQRSVAAGRGATPHGDQS